MKCAATGAAGTGILRHRINGTGDAARRTEATGIGPDTGKPAACSFLFETGPDVDHGKVQLLVVARRPDELAYGCFYGTRTV